MTAHYEEEAQAEALRRWWKENWLSLVAGLAIGLAAIFGWEAWKNHRLGQAARASQMYEELKKDLAESRTADAAAIGDKLVQEYPGSPYATDAALRLAANAVKEKKFDEAAARLDWALQHGDDDGLAALVRLRLARVRWQQGQPAAAEKLLEGEAGPYAALYDELRGDLKLAQGDRAAAAAAYQRALQASIAGERNGPDRESLQRKLDDLADVVQS